MGRIGAGLRLVNQVELERKDGAEVEATKFGSTRGLVLGGEWRFSRHAGLKLRRVSESCKLPGTAGGEADGPHWAVSMNVYFF